MVELARKSNTFVMEAVWTRFLPQAAKVAELIKDGVIGEIQEVQAELCPRDDAERQDPHSRTIDPSLAGGALLDCGPYPWTWLALILMPPATASTTPHKVPSLVSSMILSSRGVDASSVAIIKFPQPNGRVVHGTLNAGASSVSPKNRVVLIKGSKGFIQLDW